MGCSAGEMCSADGTCQPTAGTRGELVIDASAARACEILLESTTARVTGATFAPDVRGSFRERQPRTAVAITQTANAPFASGAVSLQIEGSPAAVSVKQVNCFDSTGAALANASVSIR